MKTPFTTQCIHEDSVKLFRFHFLPSQDTPGPAPVREIIREVPAQVLSIIKYFLISKNFFQSRTDYSGDISDFRTALQRLREELDRLKQLMQDLINKENLSAQDIDVCPRVFLNIRLIMTDEILFYQALKKLIQQLDQTKADKTWVNNELDKVNIEFLKIKYSFRISQKADKREMEHRVLKKDFHTTCGELSQNINDCLQKFTVHVGKLSFIKSK